MVNALPQLVSLRTFTRRGRILCHLVLLLTVFLVARAAAQYYYSAARTAPGPPQAVVHTSAVDLGEVREPGRQRVVFDVTNRGGRRLILRQYDRSCDCLSAQRPEILVPPGQTRELPLEVDLEGSGGALQLEFRYATNDPHQPILTFVVRVTVVPGSTAGAANSSARPRLASGTHKVKKSPP